MSRAVDYDEHFAKVFPFNWEVNILRKYTASAKILLDLGCGTGRHILSLTDSGSWILGIDKDEEFVEAARNKLKAKGLVTNADLIVADARFLPFKHALFDAIICMGNVLGDVNVHKKDRIAIIQEVIHTMKSEAILIIEFVHRYWQPADLLVWLYRYLATTAKKLLGKFSEYGDYTETIQIHHKVKLTFHAFTTREAKKLLASQGFHASVEKRAKFFHDWFITVATHQTQNRRVS